MDTMNHFTWICLKRMVALEPSIQMAKPITKAISMRAKKSLRVTEVGIFCSIGQVKSTGVHLGLITKSPSSIATWELRGTSNLQFMGAVVAMFHKLCLSCLATMQWHGLLDT
eukprot:SAG11_NODE_8565_length_1000_cov_1.153163_2_plen_112_part_00